MYKLEKGKVLSIAFSKEGHADPFLGYERTREKGAMINHACKYQQPKNNSGYLLNYTDAVCRLEDPPRIITVKNLHACSVT